MNFTLTICDESATMAGHSQWKNIMYRKGAQDARRAKLFTKLIREITVAARAGPPDPEMNAQLRLAVQTAKAANMPKDTIERARKRGSGSGEGEHYEEIRYEGFAPGGIAVIVEALTDNRNRTAAEVRAAFNRSGGTLAETGSVTYLFDHVGMISYAPEAASTESIFEVALEAGADDCDSSRHGHEITCAPNQLGDVRDALESRLGRCQSARLAWKPQRTVPVGADDAASLFKLLETLEDSDDVRSVSANYDVSDDVIASLGA